MAELEGCGYCGPYCPRCTSTRGNAYGWVQGVIHSKLSLAAAIRRPDNEALNYHLALDLPNDGREDNGAQLLKRGVIFDEGSRLIVERANRHDRARAAQGPFCVFGGLDDFPELDMPDIVRPAHGGDHLPAGVGVAHIANPDHPHRGRRGPRTPGQEWALMCRRVRGAVRAMAPLLAKPVTVATQTAGVSVVVSHALHGQARARCGRRFELLRAVMRGGWNPGPGANEGAIVVSLILTYNSVLRLKRRSRGTFR